MAASKCIKRLGGNLDLRREDTPLIPDPEWETPSSRLVLRLGNFVVVL